MQPSYLPAPEGLYHPSLEHDSCGVGFVAHLKGCKSHFIVKKAIELLMNLEHRGAVGAEKNAGDGAGILVQMPHHFMQKIAFQEGITLGDSGSYAVGVVFIPKDPKAHIECQTITEECISELGLEVLGWRKLPTNNATLGESVRATEPDIYHIFINRPQHIADVEAFERKLYVARKYITTMISKSNTNGTEYFYIPSLSSKTILYKGQLITNQLPEYFEDLRDEDFISALAVVHSRFSTNTFPSWPLAQPFRYIAHNGEINTLRGNINWMRARQSMLATELFSKDELEKIYPYLINDKSGSDSSIMDNVIELLTLGGRNLPHVMMMMIPEAWEKNDELDSSIKAFYEYHAMSMEPWDGPASVAFTDGEIVGATLDRNGLRPSRYLLTKDDILVMASEQGALKFSAEDIVLKGRLQPGKMFVADLKNGKIISNDEIKKQIASSKPYLEWLKTTKISLDTLSHATPQSKKMNAKKLLQQQKLHGYTLEDIKLIVTPMASSAIEPIGSMGNDTPLSVLSDKYVPLFDYFHQLFAQVTNPPIDPIREESVMSLTTYLGNQGNIFDQNQKPSQCITVPSPILCNEQLEKLKSCEQLQSKVIKITFSPHKTGDLQKKLEKIQKQALQAVMMGYQLLVLSTKDANAKRATIPSLLALGAVHQYLIANGVRTNCSLIVECADAKEIHHFATLIGYGANAICPYLVYETIENLVHNKLLANELSKSKAVENFMYAAKKGILKIMSKMGISTVQSYCGAQIFEAVGLSSELIDNYFTRTTSKLGGITLDDIESQISSLHQTVFDTTNVQPALDVGGQYAYRDNGEMHQYNAENIFLLQQATRSNDYKLFQEYAKICDEHNGKLLNLRGLLDFAHKNPIDIESVESVESIRTRFATGAMSYGSISLEAHQTMAIAMNAIGAKSNTGEGGEDPKRFQPLANGDNANSAIKQVASGRFGVTLNYLVNAQELQIKLAQGAKPGEGGQLPGDKIDATIGKTRYSTPGVGLISPPPHHDIYSIEDLKQLIHDLKNANKEARVSVKLVSEVGVGTIAAGVAKAHSDVILISGFEGGTGASPQTSIKHAGLPWELGLAEAHQTLLKNGLRSRVVLQTDGQLKTPRDIAIATLLGAEEWGVATSVLIVEGCLMMRKCHLNTCPVGIATQDAQLRKRFKGKPEHIINYITFLAMGLREIMAELGFRTIDEMVGQVEKLAPKETKHPKAKKLLMKQLLHKIHIRSNDSHFCSSQQDHGIEKALDNHLIALSQDALESQKQVRTTITIQNTNRTVGTLLSSEVTKKYGERGLDEDTIYFEAKGCGGQSFGAFLAKGITFEIEGEANDYFGKGLSGGKLIIYPPKNATFVPHNNVIIGNVAFYGATSGEAYIYGEAGERFCVRNSGANVVVESIGEHGCEYMTGGKVVILGEIGRNFAAGMSGGIAYLFNPNQLHRINTAMVELQTIDELSEKNSIKKLVSKHFQYTGSKKAQLLLENWEEMITQCVKVIPTEYKKVLEKLAKGI